MSADRRIAADVAIVGGGIVGTATALFLRQRGLQVVLLERDRAGIRASGVNFGGVRQQGRDLRELPLASRARAIWGRLAELIGTDGEFAATGHLRLARSEADMALIEAHCRAAAGLGLVFEPLGRNALLDRFPWLGQEVVGGSFCAEDGQANPRLVAPAFARAARAAGADLREGQEVLAGERDGGRFRLRTGNGLEVVADSLVNAAGAWAGRIAGWFGEPVELRPQVPQVLVTEPAPHRIGPVLGVVGGDLYLRQVARGNVIFGGGEGRANDGFTRSRPLPSTSLRTAATAVRIVPHIAPLQIIRTWTGVDGDTADGSPVVGPSPAVPGLFHAFGFCGHGFQLGPGAGEVLAELIATGATETPIEGLTIDRLLGTSPGRML